MSPTSIMPVPEACRTGLTKECFDEHRGWAKQMFAQRFLRCLLPPWLTRRLQELYPRLLEPPVPPPPVPPPPAPAPLVPAPPVPPPPVPPQPVPPPPPAPPPPGPEGPIYTAIWHGGPPHRIYAALSGKTTTLIIASSIKDGWIENDDEDWDTARNSATGKIVYDTYGRYAKAMAVLHCLPEDDYFIYRSFFYFDLSAIPAGKKIVSCTFFLTSFLYYAGSITVQEGTQADTLTLNDFGALTGGLFADVPFNAGENEIVMNAAGLEYIKSSFGSTAKLGVRDSDYDASGNIPIAFCSKKDGCHYSDWSDPDKRPRLRIVYI